MLLDEFIFVMKLYIQISGILFHQFFYISDRISQLNRPTIYKPTYVRYAIFQINEKPILKNVNINAGKPIKK